MVEAFNFTLTPIILLWPQLFVNGLGADTDIVTASAKAYINALNKLQSPEKRRHPQKSDV